MFKIFSFFLLDMSFNNNLFLTSKVSPHHGLDTETAYIVKMYLSHLVHKPPEERIAGLRFEIVHR